LVILFRPIGLLASKDSRIKMLVILFRPIGLLASNYPRLSYL
jgi:hypothetical protein